MFFTTDVYLLDPPAEPGVRSMETAAGMPAAIDMWLHPGERLAYKFVYPLEQARVLAQGRSEGELAAYTIPVPAGVNPPAVTVRQ
jgi:hypothetical protein